ncbi:MAG: glycosyltransferase, partial [Acidimicrobiales bacterium]
MTRILALTNWYPPHHLGGYELLCMDVVERMASRGHQIEVLCSDARLPGGTDPVSSRVPVHRLLKMYWRDGQPWTPSFRTQLEIEKYNQRCLLDLLDNVNPQVVSVWHMAGLSLGLLSELDRRQIPMVYGVCDDWLIYGLELDPWSRRWQKDPVRRSVGALVERAGGPPAILGDLGAANCFCFISAFTRRRAEEASRWRFGVAPVVPAGIETSAFPAPGDRSPRPWAWRLAYVGRYDRRKGTDTLLRAIPQLPRETTLCMYGRGGQDEVTRLKALAARLGIAERVRFASLDRSELAAAYGRA